MDATEERPTTDVLREVRAKLSRTGWIAGAVGSIVVFLTIGFLIPVFIDPGERWSLGVLNAPLVLVYFLDE